ncbi:MAG: SIMPL domain-containing protein [Chloroflexi bacterium]|nr:SIMPL domain-containing protein [Chloroflexota bacterium]
MSEKIQSFLLICIVFASSALTLIPPKPQEAIDREFTSPQNAERTITVYGEGKIRAILDTVEFVLFIQTATNDLNVSISKNEELFLKAMNILENHAIESKDIFIESSYERTRLIDIGVYSSIVTRQIKVTLHDIAKFQPLITDLQEGGIEQIVDIVFSTSNFDPYYEQALLIAIEAAEKKASATATSLNRKIGEPISIKEFSQKFVEPRVYYQDLNLFFKNLPENLFIEPSNFLLEVTISAQVTVTFELK